MNISVALCTYNGSKYIDEQLASIVSQEYSPSQIVISDDCSTDATWEILERWKSKYPNLIEIYRQEKNVGFNKNFGFALEKVAGDYIAFSDQDDVWYPQKLSVLYENALQYPDISVFHHDEDMLGEDVKTEVAQLDHWIPYDGNGAGILFVLNRLTGHKLLIKSSLLTDILPMPENIIYDWWINVVVAIKGKTKYVPQSLMAYRKHSESAYFSDVKKQLYDVTEPIKEALIKFSQISGMNDQDKFYIAHFLRYYQNHQPRKFDMSLFLFFVKHRKFLFKDFYISGGYVRKKLFLFRLSRAFSKW